MWQLDREIGELVAKWQRIAEGPREPLEYLFRTSRGLGARKSSLKKYEGSIGGRYRLGLTPVAATCFS